MMTNAFYSRYKSSLEDRISSRSFLLGQVDSKEHIKYTRGFTDMSDCESLHDSRSAVTSDKNKDSNESTTALDAALLLTSLASTTKKMIPETQPSIMNSALEAPPKRSFSQLCSMSETQYLQEIGSKSSSEQSSRLSMQPSDANARVRAVSVESFGLACPPYESLKDYINDHPTLVIDQKSSNGTIAAAVSPPISPKYSINLKALKDLNLHKDAKDISLTCKRRRQKPMLDPRKRFCLRKQIQQELQKLEAKNSKTNKKVMATKDLNKNMSTRSSNQFKGQFQSKFSSQLPSQGNTTVLRRKFSWKNYPELEAFLIANREEYLRHSALNYTTQQKQYNNRLTERLIELASTHGYIFDKEAFSFVTVRDRIRCYYKSYVQSSKKRGLIIGYAARKAGLLTDDDLQKSAKVEGRIIVPEV